MSKPLTHRSEARIFPFAILLLSALALPAFAQVPAGDVRIHYHCPDGKYTGWALYTWNASTENNSWCQSEVAITLASPTPKPVASSTLPEIVPPTCAAT